MSKRAEHRVEGLFTFSGVVGTALVLLLGGWWAVDEREERNLEPARAFCAACEAGEGGELSLQGLLERGHFGRQARLQRVGESFCLSTSTQATLDRTWLRACWRAEPTAPTGRCELEWVQRAEDVTRVGGEPPPPSPAAVCTR